MSAVKFLKRDHEELNFLALLDGTGNTTFKKK